MSSASFVIDIGQRYEIQEWRILRWLQKEMVAAAQKGEEMIIFMHAWHQ